MHAQDQTGGPKVRRPADLARFAVVAAHATRGPHDCLPAVERRKLVTTYLRYREGIRKDYQAVTQPGLPDGPPFGA